MAEAILGDLVVRLRGDTTHLDKATKETTKGMKSWSEGIVASMKIAAAASVAALGGIGLAVRSMVNEADKMGKAAQSLAMPVEQLSALKYAAEQADVPFETLSGALTKFNQSIGQVASGGITPAATALEALGISATTATGALKPNGELLSEVADKFARLKDDANKASLAISLFGEQGVRLAPLLNRGASGIKDLTDEAQRLGVVIDQNTAQTAARLNEALQKMTAATQGAALALAERLLPDITRIAEVMGHTAEQSKEFQVVLDGVAAAIKGVSTLFLVAAGNIQALVGGLQVLYTFARDFTTLGWDKAIASSTARIEELKASLAGTAEMIGEMWGAEGDQDRFDFAGQMEEFGTQIPQALAPAMQATVDLSAEFEAARESARRMLTELLDAPTETAAAKLDAITRAAREGVIGFGEYGAAVKAVALENQAQMENLLQVSTGALNSLFKENKAVGIATALINTYQAITKALSSAPPPINYALAAATAAQGFAQVASIRSTKREMGGPVVAGQPYIVGERRPELFVPNQSGRIIPSVASGDARSAPQTNGTLRVEGFEPGKFFEGDNMRRIAEKMLAYQRNGGKVVLVG